MMGPSATPKRGRPRLTDKPAPTREEVISAVVRLAQQGHSADVNMRDLAQALGVSPKLLYRYASGKDELLDLAAHSIFATIVLPPADVPWNERLTAIMRTTRDLVRLYPALAQPILLRNLEARDSPEVAKLVAAIKACLTDAGLLSNEADDVFFLYVALIQGELAIAQAIRSGALSPSKMPSQKIIDAKFETGLRYVIAGMMAARQPVISASPTPTTASSTSTTISPTSTTTSTPTSTTTARRKRKTEA